MMIINFQFTKLAAFLPLISLHTFVTNAAVINAGSATTSIFPLNATSLCLPIVPIDRHFKVRSFYSDRPIDEISTLMVGVDTMAILASHNWIEDMRAFRSRLLSKYPLVAIVVEPEFPALDIPNRYIIWGLQMALQDYITRDRFDESRFDLRYNDRRVGTIHFRSTLPVRPASSISSSATQSERNITSFHELMDGSKASTLNATYRTRVAIGYVRQAATLDRGDFFLTIFATLKAVAFPRTTSISADNFWIRSSQSNNVEIGFTSRDGPYLPRTEPPELQYRSIIEALREIPDRMVNHAFKEVWIELYIGNTLVGRGNVVKAETQKPFPSQSLPQASTS